MWTLERSHHSHKSGFSCGKFSIGTISVRSKIAIPNSGGQRDEPGKRRKGKQETAYSQGPDHFRMAFRDSDHPKFGFQMACVATLDEQVGFTLGTLSVLRIHSNFNSESPEDSEEFQSLKNLWSTHNQFVDDQEGNSESVQILNFKFQILALSPVSHESAKSHEFYWNKYSN